MPAPIHPVGHGTMIPVILTHPDGTTQTYWMSLKKFMEERNKGMKVKRIPKQEHKSIVLPGQEATEYEIEFIENIMDFDVAGLQIQNDKYEVEVIAKVNIKKNGKPFQTYPIKVNKEQVARAVLAKIMGQK